MEPKNHITIHWDFTDGTELSYYEARKAIEKGGGSFTTHCTTFFSTEFINCRVVDKYGNFISVKHLLSNSDFYTEKLIHMGHNLNKMLLSGSFNWQKKGKNKDRCPATV